MIKDTILLQINLAYQQHLITIVMKKKTRNLMNLMHLLIMISVLGPSTNKLDYPLHRRILKVKCLTEHVQSLT